MSFVERRKFLWLCFLASLILLALTAAAFANGTTLARLRFDELAQQSTAVARLRCLGSEFLWDRGELWTETRFEVLERNKGLLPGIVTVRTIGGISGHLHSHVDAVPIFRAGEEVYLFLWQRPGEPYRVLGWAQGTFRIARNTTTTNSRPPTMAIAPPSPIRPIPATSAVLSRTWSAPATLRWTP